MLNKSPPEASVLKRDILILEVNFDILYKIVFDNRLVPSSE